ncbi:GAF domain-containing protein [Muricoccus vinaceus]|uniref:histidine kinase n=1 Tax=Muricoccus vinaceus TaxID=424704 RepID=A0ABV6IQQ0_9PROT
MFFGHAFLTGGGGMGTRMRAHDWKASPLGLPETWPQSLRTAVSLMISSGHPMFIAWGSELTFLYNDAYIPILGAKHPTALGMPFRKVWEEIWTDIEPLTERALSGEATWSENLHLLMERNGFPEDTWYTFSYSPVRDETGGIGGMFCACTETTGQVLVERRRTFLLTLEERLRGLADAREVTEAAADALGRHFNALAGYGEIDARQERVSFERERRRGATGALIAGETRLLEAFGPAAIAELKAGRTLVVEDCYLDPRVGSAFASTWSSIGCRALIAAPLVKAGRLRAVLYLRNPGPRRWATGDAVLVGETAERTWAAVEQARTEVALRESEARWRGLFEAMHEGFALCEMVHDQSGAPIDFRYLEINAAWERLTGLPPDAVVGRLASDAIPGIEPFWVETCGRVAETGEPAHFELRLAALDRHFEVFAYRTEPGRFAALFLNITKRKAAETRLAGLVELGDKLVDLKESTEIAGAAAEIMGRILGVSRAGYGTMYATEDFIRVEREWTAPGVASVVGEWSLAEYWPGFVETMQRGEAIALTDVASDERTTAFTASYSAIGVRAALHVPLIGNGRVAAILFVHDAVPRVWSMEEIAFVRGVAERTWAAIERALAEERQVLLVREVDHRAKNALSVVQAALRLTKAPDQPSYVQAVEGRVGALARAQTLLAEDRWAGADLETLLRGELAPFLTSNSVDGPVAELRGSAVSLPAGAAQPLAMALHELATNAVKYGALSVPAGHLTISWRLMGDRRSTLHLRWTETAGPVLTGAPERRGFGSRVLEGTVQKQLGGTVVLAWRRCGLVCDIEVPLSRGASKPPHST